MPYKQHSRPIWLATLLSPLAAPVVFAIGLLGKVAVSDPFAMHSWFTWAFMPLVSLALVLPVSYLATCILGLPFVLWLRACNRLNWLWVCIGGAVMGGIAGVLCAYLYTYGLTWVFPSTGAGLGLLTGATFCLVAGITIRPTGRSPAARVRAG
jgi:hypothetical protein